MTTVLIIVLCGIWAVVGYITGLKIANKKNARLNSEYMKAMKKAISEEQIKLNQEWQEQQKGY